MPIRRLWSWLSGKEARQALALEVRLLTRNSCHLCDTAWKQLNTAQRRYGFALTVVDVDSDPALREEHGEHVPVVFVSGKVRFRGRVNPVLLKRLLR